MRAPTKSNGRLVEDGASADPRSEDISETTVAIRIGRAARALTRQLAHCEHRWWGWVYVVEAIGTGLVKLGWSGEDNLEKRLRHLQNMSPVELRLLLVMVSTAADEKLYHLELDEHRHHGEWFSNADNVVIGNFMSRHRWEGPMAVPCAQCATPVYGCDMPEVYGCHQRKRAPRPAHVVRAEQAECVRPGPGQFKWRDRIRDGGSPVSGRKRPRASEGSAP